MSSFPFERAKDGTYLNVRLRDSLLTVLARGRTALLSIARGRRSNSLAHSAAQLVGGLHLMFTHLAQSQKPLSIAKESARNFSGEKRERRKIIHRERKC